MLNALSKLSFKNNGPCVSLDTMFQTILDDMHHGRDCEILRQLLGIIKIAAKEVLHFFSMPVFTLDVWAIAGLIGPYEDNSDCPDGTLCDIIYFRNQLRVLETIPPLVLKEKCPDAFEVSNDRIRRIPEKVYFLLSQHTHTHTPHIT